MTASKESLRAADELLVEVLHRDLSDLSVQDLDSVLVELAALALRCSELTARLSRVLGHRAGVDALRLDANGAARWCDPLDAITGARAALSSARLAAAEAARCVDAAREVTATIGLVFDDEDLEVEF